MDKVKIEKFNTDGSGSFTADGRVYHVWNALPGEEVEFEVTKKSKGRREAIALSISSPSLSRIGELESHFVSCSPWQILDFNEELKSKKQIALQVFDKIPEIVSILEGKDIFTDNIRTNYRHKMEYHVYTDDNNNFHLGFFGRTEKKKIPCGKCILATKSLNETAKKIIEWLDEVKFPRPLLKTIIVRSNRYGDTIAALFAKTRDINTLLNPPFENLIIYYSNPKSPASVADEILVPAKNNFLRENLRGIEFKYGIMSFFQINPAVFEEALSDIENLVPSKSDILDFYSGVGTIGLSLSKKSKNITLVEENAEAVKFANENITLNNISGAKVVQGQAHELLEYIEDEKLLIVDPPRGGLHPKLIKKIKQVKPRSIIYLSCNIESQARDIEELKSNYKPVFARLYNFFPMTPHIESLVALKLI